MGDIDIRNIKKRDVSIMSSNDGGHQDVVGKSINQLVVQFGEQMNE